MSQQNNEKITSSVPDIQFCDQIQEVSKMPPDFLSRNVIDALEIRSRIGWILSINQETHAHPQK